MSISAQLFCRAQQVIPGGVNSPVRAFTSVGGAPKFIASASGAYIYDVDGASYLDYVGSWGPMILGHNHPVIRKAVISASQNGLSFGAPCEIEIKMAELLTQLVPSMEQVRMVNSGTEATMSAIRLARGFTKRDKIIKFSGCYHGHADSLLVTAGSGAMTLGHPSSAGVTAGATADTLICEYNDPEAVWRLFDLWPNEIAAIIVEPVAGNMGCIPPKPGFLPQLRKLCTKFGALLIFDEVMTGFRVSLGGAQSLYGVVPDLTCLGKIIGGGLPVGAFGAPKEIMEHLSPLGSVYQAGTLSGNPITLAAGYACIKALVELEPYERLERLTKRLAKGFADSAQRAGLPLLVNYVCGMLSLFFTSEASISCQSQVNRCDSATFNHFFNQMLAEGIYLPPSPFESYFLSLAHTEEDIDRTVEAFAKAITSWHIKS